MIKQQLEIEQTKNLDEMLADGGTFKEIGQQRLLRQMRNLSRSG